MYQTLRKTRGFTLIELMIVVAIVTILAALAIPMYQKQIMKSRRTSAKTALLDVASREEKFFASNNGYTVQLTSLGYASNTVTVPSASQGYYTITVANNGAASSSTLAAAYIATATPISTTTQAKDSCKNFTITDLGVQGVTGTPSDSSPCW